MPLSLLPWTSGLFVNLPSASADLMSATGASSCHRVLLRLMVQDKSSSAAKACRQSASCDDLVRLWIEVVGTQVGFSESETCLRPCIDTHSPDQLQSFSETSIAEAHAFGKDRRAAFFGVYRPTVSGSCVF